eukprot:7734442-Pyramimonas_sp.AAC.1
MDDFRCDSHLNQDSNDFATAASYASSNSISQGGASPSHQSSHSSEAVMGPSRLQLGALGVCAAASGHLIEPSRGHPVRLGQRGGRGGGEHRDSALKELSQ